MATFMELAVRLVGDISAYQRSMSEAESTARRTAEQIGKDFENAGKQIAGIGSSMTRGITMPLALAGGAAVKFGSDLQESQNKASVVFENFNSEIKKMADGAAVTLGVSAREYYDYSASIGAALKAGGMSIQDVASYSEQAVKHFADLTSFYNENTNDVAAAWQSAIRGQYEPIQRYFPFINDEYMKTYGIANKMLDGNTDKLTANQRAIILNAIAMDEKLNPALNDYAETADSFANQQRSLAKRLQDVGATFGQILLPILSRGIEIVSSFLSKVMALSDKNKAWVVGLLAAAAAAGPLLIVVGNVVTAIGAILPVISAVAGVLIGPWGLAILAVIGIVALLVAAWKNNWGNIRETAANVMAWLREKIYVWMMTIKTWWVFHGRQWWETIKATWETIKTAFFDALAWIGGIIRQAHFYMDNWWANHGRSVMSVVRWLWNGVIGVFQWAWNIISTVVGVGVAIVQAIWDRHGAAIMQVVRNTWQMVKNSFKAFFDALGFLFDAFAAAKRGDWEAFGMYLRKAWDAIWNAIVANAKLMWANLKIVFGEWWRNIKDFFANLDLKSIGKMILQGLVDGLSGNSNDLAQAAKKIADAFMKAIKGFFGIKSPAIRPKVEVGYMVAEGTANGVIERFRQLLPRVTASMGLLMPAMAAVPGMPGVSGSMASVGASGRTGTVIVPVTIKSLINTADEYTAQNVLAPMIKREIREYINK